MPLPHQLMSRGRMARMDPALLASSFGVVREGATVVPMRLTSMLTSMMLTSSTTKMVKVTAKPSDHCRAS